MVNNVGEWENMSIYVFFNCQFDFIVYSDRKKYLDVMKQFRLWKKVVAKQLVGYFYNI